MQAYGIVLECRARDSFLSELLRRSLPHELVRRTQDIAIHLVTRESEPAPRGRLTFRRPGVALEPLSFVYATGAVAAALGIGELLTKLTPIPNLSIVFLMAVLLTAVSFGVWPAIYASVLSFLVYNFFFIEPIHTFTIAEPYELLALVIFLVVGVVTSALAGRVREQATISAGRMRAMRRLYEFTRRLSGLASFDAVAEGAASEIHASLGRAVVVLGERLSSPGSRGALTHVKAVRHQMVEKITNIRPILQKGTRHAVRSIEGRQSWRKPFRAGYPRSHRS